MRESSLSSSSSRAATRHNRHRQHHHRPHGSSTAPAASLGHSVPGGSEVSTSSSNSSTSSQRARVTISYEEENMDDVFVPAPPGRTLKINVDLLLWRCRQARLKSQLCLDGEQRRELMKEAESGLRRCLALDPSDPRTYVVLGKTLMVQRRFDEARALYAEGVTNTGNNNPYIWSAWGWLEFKTGNVARARQLFDAAVVVDDTHACAWHKWGLLEKSEGNYLKARDLWMQGIRRCKRKPQSQNAYLFNALAVMAAELQRVSEARAWFDEGTSTTEGAASVALWQAWAVLEARQGDPTAVRYLFKKALGANPKSRYVHLAWALWERQSGNMLACMELLKRGTTFNPTDAALYQARALVEWRDFNKPDRAREVFQEGLAADPKHVPLLQAWGCMEAQLGKVERARELFQQGVWADPRSRDTVWIFHAWGCLERAQGNLQLARELFKAAIKVDPKADKVWFTWIAMETDAGFAERADELRIRQAEQQWEFEVPAGFTTRPTSMGLSLGALAGAGAGAGAGATQAGASGAQQQQQAAPGVGDVVAAALSPLSALRDNLARFFTVRSGKGPMDGAPRPPASPSSAQPYLPADFTGDLSLEDALQGQAQAGMPLLQRQRRPQASSAAAQEQAQAQQEEAPSSRAAPPMLSSSGRSTRRGPAPSASPAAVAVDRAAAVLLQPAGIRGQGSEPDLLVAPQGQQQQQQQQQVGGSSQGGGEPVFSVALGADDDGEHTSWGATTSGLHQPKQPGAPTSSSGAGKRPQRPKAAGTPGRARGTGSTRAAATGAGDLASRPARRPGISDGDRQQQQQQETQVAAAASGATPQADAAGLGTADAQQGHAGPQAVAPQGAAAAVSAAALASSAARR